MVQVDPLMLHVLAVAPGPEHQLLRIAIQQEDLHVIIAKGLADHLDDAGQQNVNVQDGRDLAAHLGAGLQLECPLLQCLVGPLQGARALFDPVFQRADEVVQLGGHAVERLGQGADLILALHGGRAVQGSPGDLGRRVRQVDDGIGDAAGHGQRGGDGQPHGGQGDDHVHPGGGPDSLKGLG